MTKDEIYIVLLSGADLANQSQLSNQSMTMSPPNMAAGVGVGVGGGNLWASLEQYRREIEAQCRLEFNEKMAQASLNCKVKLATLCFLFYS